jgi:hypothetical protein
VNEYTAAPLYYTNEGVGAHEWLIEFEKMPHKMDDFVYELDMALKRVNSDYEAKRHKDMALRKPVVHAVAKGTFHAWLQRKGKLGGQHKVPRLMNNRIIIDEIAL